MPINYVGGYAEWFNTQKGVEEMAQEKWNIYVAVLFNHNTFKFVTSEDSINRMAYWEDNKEAMKMTLGGAKSLVECLMLNGYSAMLVQLPKTVTPRNI